MDVSFGSRGAERVARIFDWEDSATFLWSIRRLSVSASAMVRATLTMLRMPIIVFSLLLLVGIASARISFWILLVFTLGHLLAFIVILVRSIVLEIPQLFGPSEIWRPKSSHYIYAVTICAGISLLVLNPASIFLPGLESPNPIGIPELMLFLIDNLFQVVFIGIPEALGLRLSTISPVSYQAKIMVFVFRIMAAIGIIDFAVGVIRRRFLKYEFFGTLKELYATCVFLPLNQDLEIRCGGVMEYVQPPEKFPFRDFVVNFHKRFMKEFRENVPIMHMPPGIISGDDLVAIAAYALGSHWEGTGTCRKCHESHTFITKNEIEKRLCVGHGREAFCPNCKGERLSLTWKQVKNS